MVDRMTQIVAAAVLAENRWGVDRAVTNPFEERVWLGPCVNADGERIGITECCWVEKPCKRHRAIANGEEPDCEAEMLIPRATAAANGREYPG
jgi:hypothetical protein